MEHGITGDRSCEISSYKLSATNTDTERRNFQGYQTHTPGEALMDCISEPGTTYTDEKTESKATSRLERSKSNELKRRFK